MVQRITSLILRKIAQNKQPNTNKKNAYSHPTKVSIQELLALRKERTKAAMPDKWFIGAVGISDAITRLSEYYLNKGIHFNANVFEYMILFHTALRFSRNFSQYNQLINYATKRVGEALTQEAIENQELMNLIKKNKYLFIDRHGFITPTNRPRLFGVGRMRLDSQKILDGSYQVVTTDSKLLQELTERKLQSEMKNEWKAFTEAFRKMTDDLTKNAPKTTPPRSKFLLAGTPSQNKHLRGAQEYLLTRKLRKNSAKRVRAIVDEKYSNYKRNTRALKTELKEAGFKNVGNDSRRKFERDEIERRQDKARLFREAKSVRENWKRERKARKNRQTP